MKTAKTTPSDLLSSRRAQPVRQARQNPTRSSSSLLNSYGSRDAIGGTLSNRQIQPETVEIFPAITHFADAITALPKELVRHFTLLKEVDAKIFAPEAALGQLVDAALNAPLPAKRPLSDLDVSAPTSVPASAAESVNGSVLNDQTGSNIVVADDAHGHSATIAAYDPENMPRRQLFHQCAYTMQEMLLSLDEKNHVISTANEALNKELRRLDECFPYIEQEISEEARYGSTTHWAYPESRVNKPADRTRRDGAPTNHISREAQLHADEAAARSEARKQAMLAKKGRTHQVDSDFDDHHEKGRDSAKRPHGNVKKGRPADATSSVGLGITNGAAGNGPATKRRKVDKAPNGVAMERSLSGVFGANGASVKNKVASPRGTPIPEAAKKKAKAAAQINGQARKRTTATNPMSPSLASSPIHSTFAEAKATAHGSPVPTNGTRPSTGRGRQNSTQSTIDTAKPRPSSATSNRQGSAAVGPTDLGSIAGITGRSISEVKATMKESAVNSNGEHMIEDAEHNDPNMRGGLVVGSRDDNTFKREDTEINDDGVQSMAAYNSITTKSGRASKPSTPSMPSFPEPVRSRSSRAVLEPITTKRSHKKGAGQAAQLMAARSVEEDTIGGLPGDEEEPEADADEPTYCYCNGVSYGEMVACDYDGCAKEWFHLDCVGLKVAPGKAKWYCDDCKEIMKGGKRFNGK